MTMQSPGEFQSPQFVNLTSKTQNLSSSNGGGHSNKTGTGVPDYGPTSSPGLFARMASGGRWKMAPHLAVLDECLTDITRGRLRRLAVQMPPRHGKSLLTSHYFPAWYMGTFPDRNFILTSATDNLAADFSRDARDTLAEFGPNHFGVGVRPDVRAVHHWQTTAGGSCRAAGVGGDIMGRGANILVVDDFFKNVEEALSETTREAVGKWFASTSESRLEPGGAVVLVATRWHTDDLIGRAIKEMNQGGEKWELIRFPALAERDDPLDREEGEALWPARYGKEDLERRKNNYHLRGYGWMWEALYQQNPPTTLDAEFDSSYFGNHIWFDTYPPPDDVLYRVMALDPSLGKSDKSDFSAIVEITLTRNIHMYVDADLQRRSASHTVRDAIARGRAFNPIVFGVEANGFQSLLQETFWRECQLQGVMLNVQGINSFQNKIERIRATLTEYLHQGRFHFKRNSPGANLLVEQLKGFPTAKHDDGPDALEMGVQLLTKLVNQGPWW